MRVAAFRLVPRRFAAQAFLGEGARKVGGRWNPRGVRVVYASDTLSLAALEFLVHLSGPQDAPELVCFRLEFDAKLVRDVELPKNWQRLPLTNTRALGRAWLEDATTPILRVPSFVVPSEHNYVIHPAHPKFSGVEIGPAEPFVLDPRLY